MDLSTFFKTYNKVAIAFSGGVDSAYLLYAALHYGSHVKAYYVKSAFQPEFELEDAKKLANTLHANMEILSIDILSHPKVVKNPADRCYHCKKQIFQQIVNAAHKDGFFVLLDGTNASDQASDRPGIRALQELKVLSPLRECELTKDVIRQLSKKAGLFTWNKPAYACLATRIPTGTMITADALEKTEKAESYLSSLGFTDFRVRKIGDTAKLQFPSSQLENVLIYRKEILSELRKYYTSVLLDLEVRSE